MRKTPVIAFVDVDVVPAPPVDRRGLVARMLERLAHERIMLVFCSGRTRAEVESARQAFGVFHPFITEGGGAAFIPERYFGTEVENTRKVGGYQAIEFGATYETLVDTIRHAADRLSLGVLGFGDMSVEQVARECGLSLLDARLAKLREYSEPFRLLVGNPIAERRLIRTLEGAGVRCRRGPEFLLAGTAKGPQGAVALLTTLYRVAFGSVLSVAAIEGAGLTDLVPHVDVALDSIVLNPDDPHAGLHWLERIVQECDAARAARTAARAARMAR